MSGGLAASLASALTYVVDEPDALTESAAEAAAGVFLIAAGGTGGHVFPGLQVAQELRRRGRRAVFVGTRRGMEGRLASQAGFEVEFLNAGPLNRVSWAVWLRSLALLPLSIVQAWRLMRRLRPAAVLSLGGYAAGPAAAAAALRGIPIVALEPNAYPGLANRLAARFIKVALVGFDQARRYFPHSRVQTIGTPVRDAFFKLEPKPRSEWFTVLVTGGSQGARTLNQAAFDAAQLWAAKGGPFKLELIHQTGPDSYDGMTTRYKSLRGFPGIRVEAAAFIDDMPAAFARADLVVCRSGASALAELAAAGRASLLVPYPYAADDHQLRNAEAHAVAGAGRVIVDEEFSGERMVAEIEALLASPSDLEAMQAAARRRAAPDAASRVADCLQEIVS